jgi:hypothetical protein
MDQPGQHMAKTWQTHINHRIGNSWQQIARTWQTPGRSIATAKTRHTHHKDFGKTMARVWQRRRKNMATKTADTCQHHGTSMASALSKHCNGMTTSRHKAWERQRTSVALTPATRFCFSV